MAISGSNVVVGAYQDDPGASDAGSAYVYDISNGTPTVPVATLNNPAPGADENFGASVAIDGSYAAIGATFDDLSATDNVEGEGAVYIYGPEVANPTVSVTASATAIKEGGAANFTISITPTQSEPVTVNYSLSGKAKLRKDYTVSGTPGQVVIPAGSAMVTLKSKRDAADERSEPVVLTILPGTGYSVGSSAGARILIKNRR